MLLLQNVTCQIIQDCSKNAINWMFHKWYFYDHTDKIIKNSSKSSTLTIRTEPIVKSSNFLLSARSFISDISEVLDQFYKRVAMRLSRLMKGNKLFTNYGIGFSQFGNFSICPFYGLDSISWI